MKTFFIYFGLLFVYVFIMLGILDTMGMFDDYEVYTPNDIIYVDRGWFVTDISSETTPMHLSVIAPHAYRIPYITSKLAEPCDRFEYLVRVDSLQKIY